MKNEFMLARLAMAIDCEGSVMVRKYSNKGREARYTIEVAVYNTNERLIDWLVDNFGFSKYKVTRKDREGYKPVFTAHTTSRKAENILYGAKPYLLVKDELADIALELQGMLNKRLWITDEVRFRKEELYQYAKDLNRRG